VRLDLTGMTVTTLASLVNAEKTHDDDRFCRHPNRLPSQSGRFIN
jgi:hypothetical protein